MTTALTATTPDIEAIEQVLVNGDLARLTPVQRVSYYNRVCQSLDLNPLTKPFDYINLNGKLVLYAKRDATEQLRSKRGVSVVIIAREITEDCYVVTARASLLTGRQDESIGVVNIAGLKGENRANAMMKAETKAKRRVTLSICGLGLLDETEVETIQAGGPSNGYTVTAPAVAAPLPAASDRKDVSAPKAGDIGHHTQPLPAGAVLITKVDTGTGSAKAFVFTSKMPTPYDKGLPVYKDQLASIAQQRYQDRLPVHLALTTPKSGGPTYISGITDVETGELHDDEPPEPEVYGDAPF